MQGVVGWLAGSLWGGRGRAAAEEEVPASSSSDSQQAPRNPNDDTINYEEDDTDDSLAANNHQMEEDDFSAAASEANDRVGFGLTSTVSATPFGVGPSGSLASPAPASPFSPAVAQRLSFNTFSPAATPGPVSMSSFAATPARSPSAAFFGAPATPSFGVAAVATPAAVASPDALLRSAFAAHESGSLDSAASALDRLARMPEVSIDALVVSLARRTGDSRHLHQVAGLSEADSALLAELRDKARKFDSLLRFVRTPLVRTGGGGVMTLWACLSHTAQSALLQTGELLECALALKNLLNAPPASLARGGIVSAADAAQVAARRSLALGCMQELVAARPDGTALLREGLSPQDIFFSETSRLPSLFDALRAQAAATEAELEADAAGTVSHARIARVHAAGEIAHALLVASAAFRAQPAHAALFNDVSSPRAPEELPSLSWILGDEVRASVKSMVGSAAACVAALRPGVKVVLASAPSTSVAGFHAPAFQADLFDYAYRSSRVYLQAYADALAAHALLAQASGGVSPRADVEEQLHGEFVRDRALLLDLLTSAAGSINAHNASLAAVFPVPTGGLPGVPEPRHPPYQPLYELAQEFQDYAALVQLSLSEPVRSVADRRLVFFLAHYGHAFLAQLFETLMASGTTGVARLLDLAPIAARELPTYVRERHASAQRLLVRDAAGEMVEVALDGSTASAQGVPLYDAWLSVLLKPFPQHAWLHEVHMEQYDVAAKLLRAEARGEAASVAQKKNLLSLGKLALLASGTPEEALTRAVSDVSHVTNASDATDATGVNPNEVHAIDDELAVVVAQEFLQAAGQTAAPADADAPVAVLKPDQLVQQLLRAGADKSLPPLIRVHSFCFAFDVLEKVFLPRPRHTSFDRFSAENQASLVRVWHAAIEADADVWPTIAQQRKDDPTDAWQAALADTQLGQVWVELMKPDLRCYQHEDVYVASFLQLLQAQSSSLSPSLQTNDVRVVLESTMQLVKAQARA